MRASWDSPQKWTVEEPQTLKGSSWLQQKHEWHSLYLFALLVHSSN